MEINFKGTLEEFTATFRIPLAEWHVEVIALLNVLNEKATIIMAHSLAAKEALAELNDVTNTMADAVGQIAANDQAEDDAFKAEIADLKAQLAAGKAITDEDIADLEAIATGTRARSATLKALEATLRATGSVPTDPIPVDPVIPPVEVPPVDPGTVTTI